MNPQCVGSPEDEPCSNIDDETKLIHQEFLLDPSIRVGEFLSQHSIEVNNFVRFECGGSGV